MEKKIFDKYVIIVGGGIAGMSAAARLSSQQIEDVVLIEANDYLGGRMCQLKSGQSCLELGAQWIHGCCAANSLYNYAVKTNIVKHSPDNKTRQSTESCDNVPYCYTPDGRVIGTQDAEVAWKIYEKINFDIEYFHDRDEVGPGERDKYNNCVSTYYKSRIDAELDELKGKHDDTTFDEDEVRLVLQSLLLRFEGYCGGSADEAGLYMYGSGEELPGGDGQVDTAAVIDALYSTSRNGHGNTNVQYELCCKVTKVHTQD